MRESGHLSTVSAASRFASRAGVKVLQRIEAMDSLNNAWRKAYIERNEFAQGIFANQVWGGFRRLSAQATYFRSSHFTWVAGVISNLALITGLPTSTIALAALVVGLAQSAEWLPEPYIQDFGLAILEFCRFLEEQARRAIL